MTIRCLLLTSLVGLWSVAVAASASGQNSSYYGGTTTNGMFGQNTVGGSSSTTQGRSPTTSGTLGSGGQQNVGGAAPKNVAMTARNTAPAVELTQQQGAFVGADAADNRNVLSRQNAAGGRNGAGGANGLSQLRNLFASPEFNGQGQTQSRPAVRLSLKLGFRPQPISTVSMQAFESRLTKLPGLRWVGPAAVRMDGRTAVLRGKVASEEDRELAEALAKMEPDVLMVRNEIEVVDLPETEMDLPSPSDRTR